MSKVFYFWLHFAAFFQINTPKMHPKIKAPIVVRKVKKKIMLLSCKDWGLYAPLLITHEKIQTILN